jgi:hypothetical protein
LFDDYGYHWHTFQFLSDFGPRLASVHIRPPDCKVTGILRLIPSWRSAQGLDSLQHSTLYRANVGWH